MKREAEHRGGNMKREAEHRSSNMKRDADAGHKLTEMMQPNPRKRELSNFPFHVIMNRRSFCIQFVLVTTKASKLLSCMMQCTPSPHDEMQNAKHAPRALPF